MAFTDKWCNDMTHVGPRYALANPATDSDIDRSMKEEVCA